VGFSIHPARTPGANIDRVAPSVLIVDDDPSFRELAERLLTAAGVDVVGQADSAGAGMSAARGIKPDAILLDVMLPDGDGVALARDFAELPWSPRVLLTSSSDDAVHRSEIDDSAAVGFVPKGELPSAPLQRLLGNG
jgi:DNA-binding NarL/FixJ family response regulator